MSLTVVILAAGKGRRFGGDKPLAEVGPSGQSLFEYSVHDAFKAGFKHVVFVVNDKQDTSEYSNRLAHYGDQLKVEFVVQDLKTGISTEKYDLTETARVKPWGTAHAVLVCRASINTPFIVINADDYYGRSNFELIGNYLLENCTDPLVSALPGYILKNTLTDSGCVNRGICTVDSDGYLVSIHEAKNIYRDEFMLPRIDQPENHITIDNESIVSMTFWGFHPSIFDVLEIAFQSFLENSADMINDEFYIPAAVDMAIKTAKAEVKVFQTSEKWKGVTYADDVVDVKKYIAELTDAAMYPGSRPSHSGGNSE